MTGVNRMQLVQTVRTRRWFFSAAALLFAAAAVAQPPSRHASISFANTVEAHFDEWDANHDGKLSPQEIDRLVVDPKYTDDAAAALAALKLAVRGVNYEVPDLTRAYLTSRHRTSDQRRPSPGSRTDPSQSVDREDQKVAPNFDSLFLRSYRRIQTVDRHLFTKSAPGLETCHQGPLGDCFFVAVVGADVFRGPQVMKDIIKPQGNGGAEGYSVEFPGAKPIAVRPLTDAEIAISSSSGSEGLWLPVLEKAYGLLRTESGSPDKATETATDALAKGGSYVTTLRALTGHEVERVMLMGALPRRSPTAPPTPSPSPADSHPSGEHGPTPADHPAGPSRPSTTIEPSADPARLEYTLHRVREGLAKAMEEHRLAAAGTAKDTKLPPGLNPSHAYAVIGFDAKADTVTLWNPHGETFRPRSTAGLTGGYMTERGVFTMPVRDFATVFSGVAWELSTPAREHGDNERGRGRRGRD